MESESAYAVCLGVLLLGSTTTWDKVVYLHMNAEFTENKYIYVAISSDWDNLAESRTR